MAVVNGNELLNLTGLALVPPTLPNVRTNGAKVQQVLAVVEVAAGDDDNSTFRVARIPSNAVLSSIAIANDAITGGTDYDLGIAYPAGATIDADALVDGVSLATGTSNAFSVNGMSAVDIANTGKYLWELAGLTVDPQGDLDLILRGNTIGTAAGTIAFKVQFTQN